MKGARILLLLVCLSVITLGVIAAGPPTCPADHGGKCSDSGEWKGEFFPGIPKIKYEGPSSKNPLSFKWYNAEEEILGKKMKDWLRFSIAFWHTFRGTGGDPFGAPTKYWPWEDGTNSVAMAKRRMRANFEFLEKIGVDRWCFHDKDIAPDGETLEETNKNLDEVVALAKELQGTKIRTLWGTEQLFNHPRYMHGGATRQGFVKLLLPTRRLDSMELCLLSPNLKNLPNTSMTGMLLPRLISCGKMAL